MHVFKLRPGHVTIHPVDHDVFEEHAAKRPPYYQRNAEGKMSHFAVCPQCDNPVQLIGLIRRHPDQKAPYAKHVPKDISGLAEYSQEAYNFCPYASKQTFDKNTRKRETSGIPDLLLTLMRERFDQVVYLLGRSIGLQISLNMARAMLENYLAADGHTYAWASVMNLPWMLGYFGNAQALYKKKIVKGSALEAAILDRGQNVQFSEHNQLEQKGSAFLNIDMCLMHHRFTPVETTMVESVVLLVSQRIGEKETRLLRQKIVIDPFAFQRLMNADEEKVFRREDMLAVAAEVMR